MADLKMDEIFDSVLLLSACTFFFPPTNVHAYSFEDQHEAWLIDDEHHLRFRTTWKPENERRDGAVLCPQNYRLLG